MEHFDKKQRLQNAWRLAFMGKISLSSGSPSPTEEFFVDLEKQNQLRLSDDKLKKFANML